MVNVAPEAVVDRFPYGKAPFWLTVVLLASVVLLAVARREREPKPDLVFAIFAPNHVKSYEEVIAPFEKKHGVSVGLQLVHRAALQNRLQNAMLAGTPVPDMVEMLEGGLGFFTRGPLNDVGFLDLTERLEREGLRSRLVESRLSLWTMRKRVLALPHDVHPTVLVYQPALVESLGIDVSQLKTWDDFVAVGQRISRDNDGDGVIDHFMIDLPTSQAWGLITLLRQRGIDLFDAEGHVGFNQPKTVDTIEWYLRQTVGPDKIAFECGWGQPLFKAMQDGLALFFIAPDWRTHSFELDAPHLSGRFRAIPFPVWEPGGRRTSAWGGTGLAIARATEHPELAWEFAKALYFDKDSLGKRFAETAILPPLKDAWDLPELKRPFEYYGGQRLGELFAELATETPPAWGNPYSLMAENKLSEAHVRSIEYYKQYGEKGLRAQIQRELDAAEAYVRRVMDRNVLMKQ
ncbi:MAG: extracellular solute-binding protein [Myxococcota bacterium]|nr:extracellular solute-binding protein [Myxococcota bacterium]